MTTTTPAKGKPQRRKPPLTDEHKAAMVAGRAQTEAIRAYLAALEAPRYSPDRVERLKLEAKEAQRSLDADELDVLDRLLLLARIEHLGLVIDEASQGDGFEEAEAGFVKHARAYSERKGVSYAVWRQAGVPAATLKAAGIARTRAA